jgi:hypothetical protein
MLITALLKSISPVRRMRRPLWLLIAVLGFVAFAGLQAFAQLTTADVIGTVRDASGALVTNAKVTLHHVETNQNTDGATDSAGNFAFTFLVPGHYSVRVEAPGFKVVTIPNLAISAGDRARADATLPIGQASETVEVVAQSPLLQTDNATISSTIDQSAVQDLPLNGRNFVQLVQLAPGANEGPGNGLTSGNRPDDRRSTNGLSVNGFDDVLNNEIIDGIDNNERIIGTIGVKPSIESIQEVTVQTNNYAPEIGRTAGGVVNVITKSGTNNFHGSAYEYLRNDLFDSKFVTSTVGAKPELRQNQFGASIGGPIRKDKTFFFFDYEGSRNVQGKTYKSTVPTLAQYNDIHNNGGLGILAQAKATGNLPSEVGPYTVDPIALNYLKMYPAPNAPGDNGGLTNNYIVNPRRTQFGSTYDARIDQKFNSNNNMYGRWTYNDVATYTPAALPNVVNGLIAGGGRWNFSGPSTGKANQLALYFTHVFTTNTLLQLRAAGTRINLFSQPTNNGTNGDTKMGWGTNMNYSDAITGLTPIYMGAFPDIGDGQYVPLQDIDNNFQYDGTVSYHHGNHDIKYGAGMIRRQARNVQSAAPYGTYSFGLATDSFVYLDPLNPTVGTNATDAQHKVNNLASILVGAFTDHSRNVDITPPDYRAWETDFFVQDTFKVNHKLTVIYGLRYDYYAPFTEAHNRISNFDFTTAAAVGTVAAVNNAWQIAGVNGVSASAGIKPDRKNFAPRLGFTYEVANGMILRGGFGMSYFPGNYTSNSDLKNAPFVSVYSPNCLSPLAFAILDNYGQAKSPVCTDAYSTFDAGLPTPVGQTIKSDNLSFIAEDPNLKMGVAKQFNLSIQKSFGANVLTVGYVGVRATHLPQVLNDINLPGPNNDPTVTRPLANVAKNLAAVGWYASNGKSAYDGLQTSFQRRLSSGLTTNLNYTWAHALSNVVGLSEEGDQGFANAWPSNIGSVEYGNADNDIRHRFAATVTYALPFGKGMQGAKKMLLGGWQTNAIMAWQTGHAFTVENNGAYGGTGNRALPYFSNVGADRPNMYDLGKGVASDPTLPCMQAFGHDFCPQTLGTMGNEGRNQLHGPGFHHVDLSLFKDFPIKESVKLQFRAEAYNFTNTPSWTVNNQNNQNTLLGTGTFGKIVDADPNYTPRVLQFALKVTF